MRGKNRCPAKSGCTCRNRGKSALSVLILDYSPLLDHTAFTNTKEATVTVLIDDRVTPGEIARGRTAQNAIKLLAATAKDLGFTPRNQETNAEFIGRVLRTLGEKK